jgi:6-phosphogluconolactonase
VSINSKVIITNNLSQFARKGADIFTTTAKDCVAKNGRFVVAISGGSTPRSIHRLFVDEPYCSEIPWGKTHIFWVDDRCVPENNQASNYGGAKKDFLDRVSIPTEQIHHMPGEAPPEDGALRYQEELTKFFQPEGEGFPVFDLIFLGIGEDGHTASLFPGQRALEERERFVVAVKGGDPNVSRLTMTYPVLNRGTLIVFIVSGKKKASILKAVLEEDQARFPAQKIQPLNGTLVWLLDQEAASLLEATSLLEVTSLLSKDRAHD